MTYDRGSGESLHLRVASELADLSDVSAGGMHLISSDLCVEALRGSATHHMEVDDFFDTVERDEREHLEVLIDPIIRRSEEELFTRPAYQNALPRSNG